MVASQIIVLEKRPRWAPELHRQFRDAHVVVRACRDTASLRERVSAARTSGSNCIAVMNLAGWPGECLPMILWLSRLEISTVIVGYGGIEVLEPSLRELGATTVLLPPVNGPDIGNACRRLLGQHSIESR
ncbi:MAG: hypothetical protein O3B13_05925 [Planctomycetota bacterium]|nr:hypothetical protein [Planctomycetota bacterium]MDA1162618.1 hypothetical protein [Planctomycetota bacterium]